MLKIFDGHPLEKILKIKAKILKKQQNGISLMQAQNIVAEMEGFNNWHDFKEKIKKPLYNLHEKKSDPSYIYSTTKTKPQSGYFLLGFKEDCLLNLWSSKDTFKLHSVNFIQEKSTFKYQGITDFVKAGNPCLLIGSDYQQISIIEQKSSVPISCLNKLKSVEIIKEELTYLLRYSYLSANPEISETQCADLKLLEKNIELLFSGKETLLFNQNMLITIEKNIVNEHNKERFVFLANIIADFIFSDNEKTLQLNEGVHYIQSPSIYDKNYYSFNLLLMWYFNKCVCFSYGETTENPLIMENTNLFYFNPVFCKEIHGSSLNSKLRGLKSSIHYYISYENAYYDNDIVFSYIIPNSMTLTFERINNDKSPVETEYIFQSQIKNKISEFINLENKNKIVYSPYNKFHDYLYKN